jgi:hypothetical protein
MLKPIPLKDIPTVLKVPTAVPIKYETTHIIKNADNIKFTPCI